MIRLYQMRIDLIDWAEGILMRAIDVIYSHRRKALDAWNHAKAVADAKAIEH